MKIAKSILETVGATPLVKIGRMNNGNAEIFAKVEFFNPGGSVKDRVGIAMVEAAEKSGQLLPLVLMCSIRNIIVINIFQIF